MSGTTSPAIADTWCTDNLLPKPATSQPCNIFPCPTVYSWQFSDWSSCTAVCNTGFRTRQVYCVISNNQTQVADSFCASLPNKPAQSETCNTQSCLITYVWAVSDFTACSGACGSGNTQTRQVTCISSTGSVVQESLCTATKPPTQQA